MNRARTAGLVLLMAAATAPRLLAADDATAALIKEFTGQAEAQKRSPGQLEADYGKAIGAVIDRLASNDIAAQREAAKQLEDMSYRAARPGAESERVGGLRRADPAQGSRGRLGDGLLLRAKQLCQHAHAGGVVAITQRVDQRHAVVAALGGR